MSGSEFYDHTTYPSTGAALASSAMRTELEAIESGFGKLMGLSGNGNKIPKVNSGATAYVASIITDDGTTVTIAGDVSTSGNVTLTGAGKGIVFEGTTADAFETTLVAGEPTADRTITFPDATGTLLYSGGPLGTPSSGTLTNCTGLPVSSGISGLGAGIATFLATPSSANLASAVTDETGSSGSLVFSISPVLTTPQINDTSSDHQYIFAVSELVADRTVTLPLLTGNDEFVFKDHTVTLTNKTLTTPVINGVVTTTGLTLPAFTLGGTVTSNGQSFSGTIANLGSVTTVDLNGGTIDGTTQASGTINGPIAVGGTWTAAAALTLPAFAMGGAISNASNYSANFGTGTLTAGAASFSGNVGIGTTGPLGKMHLLGSGTGIVTTSSDVVQDVLIEGATAAIGTASSLANLSVVSNSAFAADAGGMIGLGGKYTGNSWVQFAMIKGAKTNATDGNYGGYLAFGTRPNGAAMVERMRIDTAGNVGIGTTSPDKALEINSATGANLRLTYNDSDGSAVNYADFSMSSSGDLTIAPSGGDTNITGALKSSGAFGANGATAQTAYASGGALAAYGAGANGFDSGANASALHAMVVSIRAALVANGIMS